MPSILAKHPYMQIVVIGAAGDSTGTRAFKQLQHMVSMYPDQVYAAQRNITGKKRAALLIGADFCLIPSRSEPCPLVDLEFGWNGAICIGNSTGA